MPLQSHFLTCAIRITRKSLHTKSIHETRLLFFPVIDATHFISRTAAST